MTLPGLEQFLAQYDSAETRRAYLRDVNRFFGIHQHEPQDITKLDALDYLTRIKNLHLESSSIQRIIAAVKSYFKFLVGAEICTKNPFDNIRLPRINRGYVQSVSDREVSDMLGALGTNKWDLRDKSVICLMLYNGLRRQEVCNLNYDDIKDGWRVVEIHGKGNKTRVIPLHSECRKAITAYLRASDRLKGHVGEPLILVRGKHRITGQSVYIAIKRTCNKAGIRQVHPHQLRAKFASMALESGQPITSVQADMGHSSINTTAGYDKAKNQYDRSTIPLIKPIHAEG